MTDSLNVTVTAIDWPALYEPSVVDEDTDETVGAVVSITMALLLPSEFAAPGEGSVSIAFALSSTALIVPPLSVSELVAT